MPSGAIVGGESEGGVGVGGGGRRGYFLTTSAVRMCMSNFVFSLAYECEIKGRVP